METESTFGKMPNEVKDGSIRFADKVEDLAPKLKAMGITPEDHAAFMHLIRESTKNVADKQEFVTLASADIAQYLRLHYDNPHLFRPDGEGTPSREPTPEELLAKRAYDLLLADLQTWADKKEAA